MDRLLSAIRAIGSKRGLEGLSAHGNACRSPTPAEGRSPEPVALLAAQSQARKEVSLVTPPSDPPYELEVAPADLLQAVEIVAGLI
jgi:hypothetical protein